MTETKTRERWVTLPRAVEILSRNNGRAIQRAYVARLVAMGKIAAKPKDGRTNVYKLSDLERYIVKQLKPSSKPGVTIND